MHCTSRLAFLQFICILSSVPFHGSFLAFVILICGLFVTPGLLLTSKKRTAPRRELYFVSKNVWRLDGSNILEALVCSGGLVDTFKFHQIWCHFGVPVPRGLGHDNDGDRLTHFWRRGSTRPALPGYLSAFRAPAGVKVRTTEVSS